MRISINKLTGKLIEAQSGGETHPNPKIDDKEYALMNLETLKQNALNQGYKEEDIEVKFVSDEEYQTIMDAIPPPEPTEEQINEKKIQAMMQQIAIERLQGQGELIGYGID